MNLSEMRTRVRHDLRDTDSASYRWADAELDRHIDHAVRDVGVAALLQAKATLVASGGGRDLSVAALAGLVAVEAVEYPVGRYPASYTPFRLWESTLTLLTDGVPAAGEQAVVYYGKLHTLDATSSTLPPMLEELAALGAGAYAALAWASFATNRVNVGGDTTWQRYLAWGQDRMAAFLRGVAQHSRKNALRVRRLYAPAAPLPGQSTDWGP